MTSYKYLAGTRKKKCFDGNHSYYSSSKPWDEENCTYRRQVDISDGGTTQVDNLFIVDMSGWADKPAAADWTNYVRVWEYTDATEAGTEINSQCIDYSSNAWNGGNHDSVCFFMTGTDTKTQYLIYYGDTDLGAPGYTSDLTVTADDPAAGDYKVVQDSYYRVEIDYSKGGCIFNLWTRVSGGDVRIGKTDATNIGIVLVNKNGTFYESQHELTPTITEVEGVTGANAGAVLVAFKVTGIIESVAHAALQDNSAVDVTYEKVYVFCDCQLIRMNLSYTLANNCDNIRLSWFSGNNAMVDGYFSHQGYKYGTTHTVETLQDRNLGANWATKLYQCFFDITSNDGIVIHFISEDVQNLESSYWGLDDEAATDSLNMRPDNSGNNTNYTADTESMYYWIQIDDFTEADGVNDEFGDDPAHRKSQELQSTVSDTAQVQVTF